MPDSIVDLTLITVSDCCATLQEGLPPGRIRDSNRAMLLAAVADAHCLAVDCGVIRDDLATTRSAISAALESVDVLLTSGGVRCVWLLLEFWCCFV